MCPEMPINQATPISEVEYFETPRTSNVLNIDTFQKVEELHQDMEMESNHEEDKEAESMSEGDPNNPLGHQVLRGYDYEVKTEKLSSRSKKYYICKYDG